MRSARQIAVWVLVAVVSACVVWFALPQPAASVQEGPAQRVVSLAPAITETIAWLGAGDRLVGRSDWCQQPPSVRGVPAVGSTMTPSWEALVATGPDQIFVEANQSTPMSELQAVAPTTALPWLTLDDVVAGVAVLGQQLGTPDKARELAIRFQTELDVDPPADGPAVLMVMASADLGQSEVWFIRRNSLHGRVLDAAGGRNAIQRDIVGPPSVSLEQLVALDLDAIVVLADGVLSAQDEARLARAFAELEPVAHVPVRVVSGEGLLVTGPAILDLVPRVRQALIGLDP